MPHEPTNADLLEQIRVLRAEVRELQRKTVPGQLTGQVEDQPDRRFWSFVDQQGNTVMGEDAETGYGLASPLVNPALYDVSAGGHMAGGWNVPLTQDGVAWNRDWFGHVPNVNPYIAFSVYIEAAAGITVWFRAVSNGNQVLHETPPLQGYRWYHSVPIKFQLANPGEVSFLGIDVRVQQINPAGHCRYSWGGAYGRNSQFGQSDS